MTPEVRLSRAEYVEQIIGASKHTEKATLYRFLGDWLGEGLLTSKGMPAGARGFCGPSHSVCVCLHPSNGLSFFPGSQHKGERWFQHRKLITPTFHFNILDGFCEVFAENGAVLVERLQRHANTGQPVNIYPYVTKAALDVICGTMLVCVCVSFHPPR